MDKWEQAREKMVQEQIIARGVHDPQVLKAFRKVPRHLFVPMSLQNQAHHDEPLSIGKGQTISQPYMVALMTESLELDHRHKVLEIGTGSGYQTAILAEMAKEVISIERHQALADHARRILNELGYQGVTVMVSDGTLGAVEFAPFDRIMVTAGAPEIPEDLVKQLAPEGRLVVPVGDQFSQTLGGR